MNRLLILDDLYDKHSKVNRNIVALSAKLSSVNNLDEKKKYEFHLEETKKASKRIQEEIEKHI